MAIVCVCINGNVQAQKTVTYIVYCDSTMEIKPFEAKRVCYERTIIFDQNITPLFSKEDINLLVKNGKLELEPVLLKGDYSNFMLMYTPITQKRSLSFDGTTISLVKNEPENRKKLLHGGLYWE